MCDMSERGIDTDNDYADIILRKNAEIQQLRSKVAELEAEVKQWQGHAVDLEYKCLDKNLANDRLSLQVAQLRALLKIAIEYVEYVPDDRYTAEYIDKDKLLLDTKQTLTATPNADEWIRKSEVDVRNGYPLIRLGYGKVEVGTGEVESEPVILFTNHGTGVIGDNTVDEPRVNDPKDIYAEISITNIDSLNVVRKQLDIFANKYLGEAQDGWIKRSELEWFDTVVNNMGEQIKLYRIKGETK